MIRSTSKRSMGMFLRALSLVVGLSSTVFGAAAQAGDLDAIKVMDSSKGALPYQNKMYETVYGKSSEGYSSFGKEIPKAKITELIQTLLKSKEQSQPDYAQLGITKENVAKHHDEMIEAAIHWQKAIPREIPQDCAHLFEYPDVVKTAARRMTFYDDSSTKTNFSVKIENPDGEPKVVEASSTHQCPYMLPWTIKAGDETWQTYWPTVPAAILGTVANELGPNYQLLDGSKYWSDDFWHDQLIWSAVAGSSLEEHQAHKLAEELAGYDKAKSQVEITSMKIGSINCEPESLYMELVPKDKKDAQLIDKICWYDPLKEGKLTQDWNAFLAKYQTLIDAVRNHHFVSEWKAAGADRSATCEISGDNFYTALNMSKRVGECWHDAQLKGKPEIFVDLKAGKDWRGAVFLSPADERALVASFKPGEGTHWLDKERVASNPKYPSYIVVGADGKLAKKKTHLPASTEPSEPTAEASSGTAKPAHANPPTHSGHK